MSNIINSLSFNNESEVGQKANALRLDRSRQLQSRAKELIPGLTSSMMKRPEQFCEEIFPGYLRSGSGAEVVDVDGNRYIDFICGLGANSLGHQHPDVIKAIHGALEGGILHSLPVELELEVSEKIIELIPGAENVRFFKTGADATSCAVRLARVLTGRDAIITVGYNGWHDHFMYDTAGVPMAISKLSRRLPLFTPDDEEAFLELLLKEGSETAAVLLSVPYNRILSSGFLSEVRRICTDTGCILVFDEIVTGFRLARGGAQEFFNVKADLVCFSKAMAAGMPLSTIVGSKELMAPLGTLQVSTTFGGECLSLAVCSAALSVFRDTDVLQQQARLGAHLRSEINEVARLAGSSLKIVGYDPIPMWLFDSNPAKHVEKMKPFVGEMAKRGIILRRDVNFICAAHTEQHIEATVQAAKESLGALGI